MSGSILHTSHCGSTLLAYLLSPLAEVYSEPEWAHNMVRERKKLQEVEVGEGVIIKYPSGLCHLAPIIKGSKIFLYRNLGEHLIKLNADASYTYIDYYLEYCQLNSHPSLQKVTLNTILEKHAFLWAHRVLWAKESDAMFIKSRDFLSQPEKVLNKVCNLFGLEKLEKVIMPFYNVKDAGYNHSDIPLKDIIPKKAPLLLPNEGIIPEAIVENSDMVKTAREWVYSNTSLDESFL